MRSNWFGKRVLITGGTGFIGGRLAEKLIVEEEAQVRVLVRDWGSARRLARLPVEMVRGDLMDAKAVENASKDCTAIFHCAYGNSGTAEQQRRINVDGTRNILDAAKSNRVERVVHLSTVVVYGAQPDGDLEETAPRHYSGHVYMDSKLDAEKLVLDYFQKDGLPVSILQPTAVYGPFAPVWTVGVLEQLKSGRVPLINGGSGLQNVIYVDDVVSAMLLAASRPEAIGQVFLLSDGQPVSHRDFYKSHERMLGTESTIELSVEEACARWREKNPGLVLAGIRALKSDARFSDRVDSSWVGRKARKVMKTLASRRWRETIKGGAQEVVPPNAVSAKPQAKPIHLMDPPLIKRRIAQIRVRIDKARRLLGFEPATNFTAGMEATEQWARWANLLPPKD